MNEIITYNLGHVNIYKYHGPITSYFKNKSVGYITTLNVHLYILSRFDKNLRNSLNSADITLPDGKPIVTLGNMLYGRNIFERETGPDIFKHFVKDVKYKQYLIGGEYEITSQIAKQNESVVGFNCPPFRQLKSEDLEELFKDINDKKPDIIWVSLGAPKQELFIYNNYHRLDQGKMIGVGAAFNYYAGIIKRAPALMQTFGLEWLYRLFQEPRKLWKRYLLTNSLFTLLFMIEATKKHLPFIAYKKKR